MKRRKIYVKEDFKVKKYKVKINSLNLINLSKKCLEYGYNNLAGIIYNIVNENNKLRLSGYINDLIEYETTEEKEKKLKDYALLNIMLLKKVDGLDYNRIYLDMLYQFDLMDAYYISDNNAFTEEIQHIPFINSLSLKK